MSLGKSGSHSYDSYAIGGLFLLAATGTYLGLVSASCNRAATGSPPGPFGGGPTIQASTDLHPEASPGSRADLVLGGTKIPVDLVYRLKGDHESIDILTNGQPVESERYVTNNELFGVVEAAGEIFDPPLPLLKFPSTVGQPTEWTGSIPVAERKAAATATVRTSSESVYVKGVANPAIKVEVSLEYDSQQPGMPAKRMMTFWIAKDKGVLKRDFAASSTRQPQEK